MLRLSNGSCVDCSLRGFREVRSVEGQGTRSSSVFALRVKWFALRSPLKYIRYHVIVRQLRFLSQPRGSI